MDDTNYLQAVDVLALLLGFGRSHGRVSIEF